jgi:hypothetical protein
MVRRQGFVVRSNDGYWNVVVKDTSTNEWFHFDQSLTNLADAVGIMKADDIEPLYKHPVEDWMRTDMTEEQILELYPNLKDEPTMSLGQAAGVPVDDLLGKSVGFSGDDCAFWHELNGDDEYSKYYRHLKEVLDSDEG